ncbi:GL21039 [Drosophila persimilis]|uniref:GL21039 n=1 Tax=Drosophila persimilis TaxID=7234 RepID=B4HAV6_DROPE|nr:GL21039 [Drosophila persimilis]
MATYLNYTMCEDSRGQELELEMVLELELELGPGWWLVIEQVTHYPRDKRSRLNSGRVKHSTRQQAPGSRQQAIYHGEYAEYMEIPAAK